MSGRPPSVSIVIPTYNRVGWLRGAIDSVLAQDYPDLELVVVDDGSQDGTADLLADYARREPERRFRWLSQENSGQAAALNRGNALARGELLGYLSDDDLLAPGAITRLAAELAGDPGVVLAYPAYYVIDGDGEVVDVTRPVRYSPAAAVRLHDTIVGPAGLVRRSALEPGGWDGDLRWVGDLIMWLRVGMAGRAVRVDEPLAFWRRHEGSATIQLGLDHAREHLAVAERGLSMLDSGLAAEVEAEALRNAAMFSRFFGGENEAGEQYLILDLHLKEISVKLSGQDPSGPIDWARVDESAALYRELAQLTVRPAASVSGAGPAAARSRLREAGLLPLPDGTYREPQSPAAVECALIDAALDCTPRTDLAAGRFLIVDREQGGISEPAMERLRNLGYPVPVEQLREVVERVRGSAAKRPGRLGRLIGRGR
jgi:hypothetical protein